MRPVHIVARHMPDRVNLAHYLPLTQVSFEILLALAGGEQHGYAVMLDIEHRSGGAVSLHAGSLYRALNRLLETELIEELDESPEADNEDERRRYYRLTAKGLEVARGEARRLEQLVAAARLRRLLPKVSS
jgi:DNA-binding PadR family transcriptional regulator